MLTPKERVWLGIGLFVLAGLFLSNTVSLGPAASQPLSLAPCIQGQACPTGGSTGTQTYYILTSNGQQYALTAVSFPTSIPSGNQITVSGVPVYRVLNGPTQVCVQGQPCTTSAYTVTTFSPTDSLPITFYLQSLSYCSGGPSGPCQLWNQQQLQTGFEVVTVGSACATPVGYTGTATCSSSSTTQSTMTITSPPPSGNAISLSGTLSTNVGTVTYAILGANTCIGANGGPCGISPPNICNLENCPSNITTTSITASTCTNTITFTTGLGLGLPQGSFPQGTCAVFAPQPAPFPQTSSFTVQQAIGIIFGFVGLFVVWRRNAKSIL